MPDLAQIHRTRETKQRLLLLGPAGLHLLLFFVVPIAFLLRYSFYRYVPGVGMEPGFVTTNYKAFLLDPFYRRILISTIQLGVQVTLWTLILGFPLAYAMAKASPRAKGVYYIIILMPLLTSAVVRTYGWMILLSRGGLVNSLLMALGIVKEPVSLMYNVRGVTIALVEVFLPYMVLSLQSVLENLKKSLEEAAQNLGADPLRTFALVTLPLTVPGIVTGSILVFVLTIAAFVTPSLLGGPMVKVMATIIYQQGLAVMNWPFAGAMAFILLLVVAALILLYNKVLMSRKVWG